ncbi:MAG: hypothetical protein HY782_03195 [Chloroflexi bacterium]|nr:hypothetical protein [Chloroflexota bacterium]
MFHALKKCADVIKANQAVAIIAAERGHQVTLVEKTNSLGGLLKEDYRMGQAARGGDAPVADLTGLERPVRSAGVVGAGKMGNSIALVLSRAGINVALVDVDASLLNNAITTIRSSLETLAEYGSISNDDIPGILKRIHPCTDLASLGDVDFIEEAVPEVAEIKRQVLTKLDALLPLRTAIASNTSGLDVFSLAEFKHPERLVVAHWFLPAHIVPLVEVVPGPLTSAKTVNSTVALLERIGKKPVTMKGFARSFIVNKIQNAMAMAAMELLGTGLVTPQDKSWSFFQPDGSRALVQGNLHRGLHHNQVCRGGVTPPCNQGGVTPPLQT